MKTVTYKVQRADRWDIEQPALGTCWHDVGEPLAHEWEARKRLEFWRTKGSGDVFRLVRIETDERQIE